MRRIVSALILLILFSGCINIQNNNNTKEDPIVVLVPKEIEEPKEYVLNLDYVGNWPVYDSSVGKVEYNWTGNILYVDGNFELPKVKDRNEIGVEGFNFDHYELWAQDNDSKYPLRYVGKIVESDNNKYVIDANVLFNSFNSFEKFIVSVEPNNENAQISGVKVLESTIEADKNGLTILIANSYPNFSNGKISAIFYVNEDNFEVKLIGSNFPVLEGRDIKTVDGRDGVNLSFYELWLIDEDQKFDNISLGIFNSNRHSGLEHSFNIEKNEFPRGAWFDDYESLIVTVEANNRNLDKSEYLIFDGKIE